MIVCEMTNNKLKELYLLCERLYISNGHKNQTIQKALTEFIQILLE